VTDGDARRRLHAPFRPRAARLVASVLAAVVLVLAVVLAVVVPTGQAGPLDRAGFVAFGALVSAFLYRQATVRAVPDEQGLTVRNLVFTRRLAWAQIVSVRFGQGRPWVQLDLGDGDTLAVMGVQRADGDLALQEARRLATLVELHSRTDLDD